MECGNTIWKKVVRRRELDRDSGGEILEEPLGYRMQVRDTEGLIMPAYEQACGVGNPKLAVYDFVCLALAEALEARLVTADRGF